MTSAFKVVRGKDFSTGSRDKPMDRVIPLTHCTQSRHAQGERHGGGGEGLGSTGTVSVMKLEKSWRWR